MQPPLTQYIKIKPAARQSSKERWWKETDDNIHAAVFSLVDTVEKYQSPQQQLNIQNLKLYDNRDLLSTFNRDYNKPLNLPRNNTRITLNVIKSCIDTVSAKIAKSKPRPLFITNDGDYSLQTRAKNLTRYIDGVFTAADVYSLGQQAFVDSCIFGTGILKVYADDDAGEIKVERVFINELIVDELEAFYGKPRQIHRKKMVDKATLIEAFPDRINDIERASEAVATGSNESIAEQVIVVESWHLRSGKKASDGKHSICIDNATLFSETYEKDYFPFVFLRWSPRCAGFYGLGLAEEITGIQVEINLMLRNIQLAQKLAAVPRVFIETGSNVVAAHINNEIGGIVKYTGTNPPIITPSPAMSTEVYSHLENLYKKAFEITGISMLSATAKKPAGLDSAVAIREYSDIESERFSLQSQRYEQLYMDIATIAVDLSRDMYMDRKTLSVKSPGRKFIETIRWKDVCLDDDKFYMQVFPIDALPRTPAARLNTVQDLIKAGFMSKDFALSLLDFPDLDSFISLQTASLDDWQMMISNILEEGEYNSPEPFQNLQLGLSLVQSSFLRAKTKHSVKDDKLELLRKLMGEIKDLIAANAAPPPQQQQPAATGVPTAAPTSDLLPTANIQGQQ